MLTKRVLPPLDAEAIQFKLAHLEVIAFDPDAASRALHGEHEVDLPIKTKKRPRTDGEGMAEEAAGEELPWWEQPFPDAPEAPECHVHA